MSPLDYDKYLSPCKNICLLDPDEKYCTGCLRTKKEISSWWRFSREEKLSIMDDLKEREKHGYPKGLI
jgi:predicted Fe-S protein YdhL (DUF1289 family)